MEGNKQIILGSWRTEELSYLAEIPFWNITEKIDGTNIRVIWDGNRVSFAGKTDNAQLPPRLVGRLQELFGGPDNEAMFEELFEEQPVTLYGEGFGSKIQSGGDYFPDSVEGQNEFALFDIKINDVWLQRPNVGEIARNLNCDYTPMDFGVNIKLIDFIQEIIQECKNNKIPRSRWGHKKPVEGWVARTSLELRDRRGARIITKLKYEDFEKIV